MAVRVAVVNASGEGSVARRGGVRLRSDVFKGGIHPEYLNDLIGIAAVGIILIFIGYQRKPVQRNVIASNSNKILPVPVAATQCGSNHAAGDN